MDNNNRKTRPGIVGGRSAHNTQTTGWTLTKGYESYMDSRDAKGVSPATVIHYGKTWALFSKYALAEGLEYINDVEKRHVEGFFAAMGKADPKKTPIVNPRGGAYAPTTRAKCAVDLKAIFSWLAKETERDRVSGADVMILRKSPFDGAVMPKQPDLILPPYEEPELAKLLEACAGSHPLRIRDRALMLTLLDSAVRREECLDLRIREVDLENGTITVLDGKGGVTRTAVICSITVRALRKYLDLDFMKNLDSTEPLWWGKHGPLGYDGLGEVLERIGRRANVVGSCHKLRRTGAIRMLRNGADLETVRAFLGHSDYQVIRKYLAYSNEDLKRAHEKFSPVSSLEAARPKPKGLGKKQRRSSQSRRQGFG